MTIVQKVLPAIRVLIMKSLLENHGMRQADVSVRMKLTQAAITQYVKGKRGAAFVEKIRKSEKTMKIIWELAEALASDNVSEKTIADMLCQACMNVRFEGICGLGQASDRRREAVDDGLLEMV